ncbi:unnamed protein product [Heterotrigona itama]|uniref:Uncharacterized protein n=1 Tax=Heterotrigona itama TaxID=395501 RepID=A0A6V7HII1_9HYME|nr:unnamed protein product [Heterotrigona itama]
MDPWRKITNRTSTVFSSMVQRYLSETRDTHQFRRKDIDIYTYLFIIKMFDVLTKSFQSFGFCVNDFVHESQERKIPRTRGITVENFHL